MRRLGFYALVSCVGLSAVACNCAAPAEDHQDVRGIANAPTNTTPLSGAGLPRRVTNQYKAAYSTVDAGMSEPSAAGSGGVDTGGAGTSGAGGFGGGLPFCIHPPDCVPVITSTVGLETCCPNNGESCGYAVLYPQELDDGTCRPNSAVFGKLPGQDEQRVETEGAPDQLITPECETRALLAFTLPGCCMPDNRCGISTYHIADILLLLGGIPAPFTRVQCTSVETLNFQFRLTPLAGMGQIPPSDGPCDYQALDEKLPHKMP